VFFDDILFIYFFILIFNKRLLIIFFIIIKIINLNLFLINFMENSEAATEDNGLEMRYDHLYKSKINYIKKIYIKKQ